MPRFKSNEMVTQRYKQELDYPSNCIVLAKTKSTRKTPDWMIRTTPALNVLFVINKRSSKQSTMTIPSVAHEMDGTNFIQFNLKP